MIGYRPNGKYVPPNHLCRKLPGYREVKKASVPQSKVSPITLEKLLQRRKDKGFYQNHPEFI